MPTNCTHDDDSVYYCADCDVEVCNLCTKPEEVARHRAHDKGLDTP